MTIPKLSPLVGYYEDSDEIPAFDPGFEVECPICEQPLAHPDPEYRVNAISILVPGDQRSFFFRVHRYCYQSLSTEDQVDVDGRMVVDQRIAIRNSN